MAVVTLTELKTFLNITLATNDDELMGKIAAAQDVVQGIVGTLTPTTVTETHYGVNTDVLVLRQVPVSAITAVSMRYFAYDFAPFDILLFTLDTDAGLLRRSEGSRFFGDVMVSYTTGTLNVPTAVREAVLVVAGHLWETQRAASAPRRPDNSPPVVGMGYAIPSRAVELLAPFQKGPKVA